MAGSLSSEPQARSQSGCRSRSLNASASPSVSANSGRRLEKGNAPAGRGFERGVGRLRIAWQRHQRLRFERHGPPSPAAQGTNHCTSVFRFCHNASVKSLYIEGYSGTHDVMRSLSNPAACHQNKNGLFMKGFSYHTQSAEQAITCIISPGSTAKKSSTCASGSTPRNKRQEARIGRHVSGFSNRWWPR